jgi:hypothetical protein
VLGPHPPPRPIPPPPSHWRPPLGPASRLAPGRRAPAAAAGRSLPQRSCGTALHGGERERWGAQGWGGQGSAELPHSAGRRDGYQAWRRCSLSAATHNMLYAEGEALPPGGTAPKPRCGRCDAPGRATQVSWQRRHSRGSVVSSTSGLMSAKRWKRMRYLRYVWGTDRKRTAWWPWPRETRSPPTRR